MKIIDDNLMNGLTEEAKKSPRLRKNYNGSPRKNGNTAQLLKRAMDGAREAGGKGQGITN